MSTYDEWKAREPQGEPWCDWCNDRGVRDVQYEWRGSVQDGEKACSNCCDHPELMLLPGPGIACSACGDWFEDRDDAAASRKENAAYRAPGLPR